MALASRLMDERQAYLAESSFREFVGLFWPLVSTTPLVDGWYLDAICEHLQALPQLKRLLINIPPRHGKSTLCAVLYPAWLWVSRPQTRFLCSSYSLQLSLRDSVYCRQVIESPLYQRLWKTSFQLCGDHNTKSRFHNDRLGYRLATSTSSGNTGEGCDILIGDDLNNVSDALSDIERQNVLDWWQGVISTRLNPGGLDCKVIIQQRCHSEDITGHILDNDEAGQWVRLVLPWEYEPERRTVTPIWSDPRKDEGEPLSTLYTPGRIEELKGGNGLGPTGFATQFQQRPIPVEGAIYHEDWFGTYEEMDEAYLLGDELIKKAWCRTFVTTDLAISLRTTADYTVAQVWAVTPHNHLILVDEWRERVEGPEAIKAFRTLHDKYRPDAVYVEDVQFQRMMLQMLRQAGLPVKGLKPNGQDKLARSQRSLVKSECGQVWLPDAGWVDDWLEEVCAFPYGRFDDRVDCLAWAGIVSAKYPVRDLPKEQTPEEKAAEAERKRQEFLWRD